MTHAHTTTPDPILERFKAQAKPSATVEELVAVLRDFALRVKEQSGNPTLAFHALSEDLEGEPKPGMTRSTTHSERPTPRRKGNPGSP